MHQANHDHKSKGKTEYQLKDTIPEDFQSSRMSVGYQVEEKPEMKSKTKGS